MAAAETEAAAVVRAATVTVEVVAPESYVEARVVVRLSWKELFVCRRHEDEWWRARRSRRQPAQARGGTDTSRAVDYSATV